MDLESKEFLPQEPHTEEEHSPSVPEQTDRELPPRREGSSEFMQMDPVSEELYMDSYPEPLVDRSFEHEVPYGRGERVYVNGADPYGNVSNGVHGYAPKENPGSPYEQGYYRPAAYGQPYVTEQPPYYGGNYVPLNREAVYTPPMTYAPPKPLVRKNNKPVVALILGILAMGILNFMPFVALVLSLIALCTGYTGLKQGELPKGKRICGYIGLALGIIGLILSVTMLITLLTLSIRASKELSDSVNSIYR